MGEKDYEAGLQNPTAPINIGAPGWMDVDRGQRDAVTQQFQQTFPRGPASGGGAGVGPRTPHKSLAFAIVLAFVAGPIGLLYATRKGALALVAGWLILPLVLIGMDVETAAEAQVAAAELLPRLLGLLWPVVWVASLIVAPFATSRYNRRVQRNA